MIDIPGGAGDLADIHAAFAAPVNFERAGIAGATVVDAVAADMPGDPFTGPGQTLRRKTFTLRQSALPQRPGKNDVIEEAGGARWKVIEITDRDDVAEWDLTVERTS